jgi:hypothetical protein
MGTIVSFIFCGPSRRLVPQMSVHRLLAARVGQRSALMLGNNIEVGEYWSCTR